MSERIKKVNELIKEEISKIILEEIDDPRLKFVTITSVEATPDLRNATVWVSFFDNKEEEKLLSFLNENVYKIQGLLNKKLAMRHIPRIEFSHDNSLSYAQHIEDLLKEAKGEKGKKGS